MRNFPLLRFLIPLCLGIILYHIGISNIAIVILFCCSILLLILNSIKVFSKGLNNYLFYIIVFSASFINSDILNKRPEFNHSENPNIILCRVDDIVHNDVSTSIIAKICGALDSNFKSTNIEQEKVKFIIQGNNYNLKEGSIIATYYNLQLIKNLGNPYEFDYASYLRNQNIFRQQFIKENEYSIVGYNPTLLNYCSHIRAYLTLKVLHTSIDPEAQQFLIAILFGDKHLIENNVYELFKSVGITHIIALSGFHLGLIAAIIYFLLSPLNFLRLRRFRIIITLIALTLYTLITGCAPSTMRALIMIYFVSISIMLYRYNSIWNAIIGSAIFILILNPNEILNVGFQLSYLAVIGILLLNDLLKGTNIKVLNSKILSLFFIPIIAFVSTAIISEYYFNNISINFLFPNILLVILLPVFIVVGISILITNNDIIIYIFNSMYKYMIKLLQTDSNIFYNSVINIDINIYEVLLYYLCLTFIYLTLKRQNGKYLLLFLSSAILLISINTFKPKETLPKLIILNDYYNTPIIQGNGLTLKFINVDNEYTDLYATNNKRFISKFNIKQITLSKLHTNYFLFNDKRFIILDNSLKNILPTGKKIRVDYIIISNGFSNGIDRVCQRYIPSLIIFSGNMNEDKQLTLEKECKNINIPFYSIRANGAYVIE